MNIRSLAWLALTAGIVGCTSHYIAPQNDRVVLYLKQGGAEQVFLACSVDGYVQRPAHRTARNLWEAAVHTSGEFRYFYIIDGRVYVPPCRFMETDDWGGKNCIYVP